MTHFADPTFSVARNGHHQAYSMCADKGHSGTDSRGDCFCCGQRIADGASSRFAPPIVSYDSYLTDPETSRPIPGVFDDATPWWRDTLDSAFSEFDALLNESTLQNLFEDITIEPPRVPNSRGPEIFEARDPRMPRATWLASLDVAPPETAGTEPIDVSGRVVLGTLQPGDELLVGRTTLRFFRYPTYSEAHPGEEGEHLCTACAIAQRPNTLEYVLLWLVGGINWSISRHQEHADQHRRELA